ncbi:MAG: START domain-containing protein [bacterium]
MRKSNIFFILLGVFFLILFCNKIFAWEKTKESNGITIYTRKIEGSHFKEFKAVMRVKTTLSGLIALFEDIESAPHWIETCIERKLLKRISPSETYTYMVNAAPWPIKDRDSIVHNIIEQDPNSGVVNIRATSVPDFIPEKSHLMRVKDIEAYWRFTPLADGYVEIVYRVYNNPGGYLPSWLVNIATISYPYKSMINLKKVITQPKYQQAHYDFISQKLSE